jgi:hypothetical protein
MAGLINAGMTNKMIICGFLELSLVLVVISIIVLITLELSSFFIIILCVLRMIGLVFRTMLILSGRLIICIQGFISKILKIKVSKT